MQTKKVIKRIRLSLDGKKSRSSAATKTVKKLQNRKTRYLKTDFCKIDMFEEL